MIVGSHGGTEEHGGTEIKLIGGHKGDEEELACKWVRTTFSVPFVRSENSLIPCLREAPSLRASWQVTCYPPRMLPRS